MGPSVQWAPRQGEEATIGSGPYSRLECKLRLRDLNMSAVEGAYLHRVRLTPRVRVTPEDDSPFFIGGITQHLVQLHSEPVQMTNVEWAEVAMEGVV